MAQPKIRTAQLYNIKDATINGDNVKVSVDEFDTFATGQTSPLPSEFSAKSMNGFIATNSTDFPSTFYTGMTVVGSAQQGFELAVNWNAEETRPSQMFVRVRDDTAADAWTPWNRVDVGENTYLANGDTPTGGSVGDYAYDVTNTSMWALDDTSTWRSLTKLFAQDDAGVWRDVQQKWVKTSNGQWVQVFGDTTPTFGVTPLYVGYFTDFGTTWYSDAPDGSTAPQPLGEHVYHTIMYNDQLTSVTAHLYGGVDDTLTSVAVNGVNVLTGPQMGFGSPTSSTNFSLVPGVNVVTISINNGNTFHAFALKLRRTSDNFVFCDIDDWRIGSP